MSRLARLVEHLTAAERRYVSRTGKLHQSGNNSRAITLFRALCKNPSLSDSEITSKLKYQVASQLKSDKYYLHNFILRALQDFHRTRYRDFEVMGELQSVRVLREKGLYQDALSKLNTALQMAREAEMEELEVLLLRELRRFFYQAFPKREWKSEGKKLIERLRELRARQEFVIYYLEKIMEVNAIKFSVGITRNQSIRTQIEKLIQEELLQTPATTNLEARIQYHSVRRTAFDLLGDYKRELEESEANARLMLSDKAKKLPEHTYYVLHLSLYMDTFAWYWHLNQDADETIYNRCREALEEWKQNKKFKSTRAIRAMYLAEASHVHLTLKKNKTEELSQALLSAKRTEERFSEQLTGHSRSTLYLLYGAGYLILKQYEKAVDYFTLICQEGEDVHREDVLHISMILEVITHFELKNYRYVLSKGQSYRRFFKAKENKHASELTCLKYIRKLAKSPEIEGYNAPIWETFRSELLKMEVSPEESQFFNFFNVRQYWLERKTNQ